MPTFTTTTLENLLETDVTRPAKSKDSNPLAHVRLHPQKETQKSSGYQVKKPQHVFFSPALYTTPEPTPMPESPSSFSPNPYRINSKRREPRPQKTDGPGVGIGGTAGSRTDGIPEEPGNPAAGSIEEENDLEVRKRDGDGGVGLVTNVESSGEEGVDIHDLPGARDWFASGRRADAEDECVRSPSACQSEFFDANEEFSRDGSPCQGSPFSHPGLQAELDSVRSDLSLEVEKRKKAEEAVEHMHAQWGRIAEQLSQIGFSFPRIDKSGSLIRGSMVAESLSQQIAVARLVAEAVGRGNARAEAEAAAESLINAKNVEIARLGGKLQYSEAVNHEMTQRYLENVEAARRLRQRREMRKTLFWSCVGFSFSVGACLLTYSYLPHIVTKSAAADSFSNTETSKR